MLIEYDVWKFLKEGWETEVPPECCREPLYCVPLLGNSFGLCGALAYLVESKMITYSLKLVMLDRLRAYGLAYGRAHLEYPTGNYYWPRTKAGAKQS